MHPADKALKLTRFPTRCKRTNIDQRDIYSMKHPPPAKPVTPTDTRARLCACDSARQSSLPGPNDCVAPGTDDATARCLSPTLPPEHYIEQAGLYFDTLDTDAPPENIPDYNEFVARWEWEPWLLLTGYGERDMIQTA